MPSPMPIVSQVDKSRLEPHLGESAPHGPATRLRALLSQARVVPPERVPSDVVTMNSRVVVRRDPDESPDVYLLAYPDHAADGVVSVLSPLGCALLAAREGERLSYMGARAVRSVTVESIEYQPERAGDFNA